MKGFSIFRYFSFRYFSYKKKTMFNDARKSPHFLPKEHASALQPIEYERE